MIIFIKFFIPLSDCFRVTTNFGGDCFAQTRRLFASGTKEEEQGAWEGKAGTEMCKPVIGFVPDGNTDLIFHVNTIKMLLVLNCLKQILGLIGVAHPL